MAPSYEMPVFSFLSIFLVLLPSPWHWKARNVATLSLIAWLVVCNLIRGINSIIWMDNVIIHYKIWCDISTKILIGMTIALPACSFCLTRHLEHVASARSAISTAADKRRRRIVDLCITFGIPLLIMALHYTVQGHRFDIIEDVGCQPVTYTSIVGLLIVYAPPVVLSIGSLIFAALALRHFAKRRLEFEQHLRNSQSSLNTARYMRLMALALSEMFWGTSLGTYVLYSNLKFNGLRPLASWKEVHYNFSRIAIWPQFLMSTTDWGRLMLSWWILPCTAILFFIFFGLSEEAREGYGAIFSWVWRWILRVTGRPVDTTTFSKGTSLPQFTLNRSMNNTSASCSKPDDISLASPGVKRDISLGPIHGLRKVDLETASAMSLTFPDIAPDYYSVVQHNCTASSPRGSLDHGSLGAPSSPAGNTHPSQSCRPPSARASLDSGCPDAPSSRPETPVLPSRHDLIHKS